ncbi:hypothetical protein BD779DRAFT_996152 [Infundibulicybe gibba]|nr:hypothetical protein BD779DRAFT_996152 [Infundibulicybe gibba]
MRHRVLSMTVVVGRMRATKLIPDGSVSDPIATANRLTETRGEGAAVEKRAAKEGVNQPENVLGKGSLRHNPTMLALFRTERS